MDGQGERSGESSGKYTVECGGGGVTDRLSASVVVVDWKCVAFLPPMQALLVIVALSEFGMNERVDQRANKMQIAVLRPAPDALPPHMRTWEEGSNAANVVSIDQSRGKEGGAGKKMT